MMDNISFGVTDIIRSTAFYDQVFAPLGVSRLFDVSEEDSGGLKVTGYGDDHPWFRLAERNATTGMIHIAFRAKGRADLDAFILLSFLILTGTTSKRFVTRLRGPAFGQSRNATGLA